MLLARRKYDLYEVEAQQLNEQHPFNNTTKWLIEHGLPWLKGDPSRADLLENPDKLRHMPGIYIEPVFGDLVIRNKTRIAMHASIGDWIIRDPITDNFWVVKPNAFAELYERI